MSNPPYTIKLAHFDMAGTTIDDEVGEVSEEFGGKPLPLVIDGFQHALRRMGYDASFDLINRYRGANKLEALKGIISELDPEMSEGFRRNHLAEEAHSRFIERAIELVPRIKQKEGISDLFKKLKEEGVYVTAATGFPDQITEALIKQLGWVDDGLVDLVVNASKAGGGRPKPNMINYALIESGLMAKDSALDQPNLDFDYSIVLKVGDTVKDAQEGLGIGATTIVTLEGTQSREFIEQKGGVPHYFVGKTREILELIDGGQIVLHPHK